MRKSIFIIILSLFLASCDGLLPVQSEKPNREFHFTEAAMELSETGTDRSHQLLLSLSDSLGNRMDMEIRMNRDYLEGGIYKVTDKPDGKFECTVSRHYTDSMEVYQYGSVIVSRNDDEYSITAELEQADGFVTTAEYEGILTFDSEEIIPATEEGRGTEFRDLVINSEILGRKMLFTIYLPENYSQSEEYPVLYALHGMNADNNAWFDSGKMNMNATALADAGGKDMIIVSPYAMNTFYCNGVEDDLAYEDFFFQEFIPYIENRYSIRSERDSRSIAGISMGGYGAIYYGLTHPEMFCNVYACSPATFVGSAVPDLKSLIEESNSMNYPCITVEIGSSDFLILTTGSFIKKMKQNKLAYEYIVRDGKHDWRFWRGCTPKILDKADSYFK
jgi:enterochelin esterase-like enzyme